MREGPLIVPASPEVGPLGLTHLSHPFDTGGTSGTAGVSSNQRLSPKTNSPFQVHVLVRFAVHMSSNFGELLSKLR